MTDTEVLTPEVMPSPGGGLVHAPGTEVTEVAESVPSALDRAAEAALAMPGVPGRDEFLSLAAQAKLLSLSGAAPKEVRNNPHIAFHVAMVGRDLGISPTAALNLIDVISTQNGPQLSLSPQLLNAQITRLGLGSVRPIVQEIDRCVAGAFTPDGVQLGTTEFTWEDARMAGLVGPECEPGQHKEVTRQGQNGSSYKRCGCNQGYRTYPRRMMWWRAAGFCANDWFPAASVGLYSPEELGAVVDEHGRPLDPAQVALPPGYDDPVAERAERQAAGDRPAAADKLWDLQLLVYALPPEILAEFRAAWKANDRLSPFGIRTLPQRLMGTARAMANGQWAAATRAGWDKPTEEQRLQARLAEGVGNLAGRFGSCAAGTAPAAPVAQERPEGPPGSDTPASTATGDTAPLPDDERAAAVEEEPESEQDWTPVLREVSAVVSDLVKDLPPEIRTRIPAAVEGMHHTVLNRIIDEGQEAANYPPTAPVGLRRMVCVILLAQRFEESGEVPAEVTAVEEKAKG